MLRMNEQYKFGQWISNDGSIWHTIDIDVQDKSKYAIVHLRFSPRNSSAKFA